jgi:hypothetical protein
MLSGLNKRESKGMETVQRGYFLEPIGNDTEQTIKLVRMVAMNDSRGDVLNAQIG